MTARGQRVIVPTRRATLDRDVVRLAVPALGALVAEPLFLLGDAAVVGRLGTLPLAGLGVAGAALSTAVGLFVFLAYGTTAAVARRAGAGDLRGGLSQGIDGIWLALGLGTIVAAAGIAAAEPLMTGLGASTGALEPAVTYLRISLVGLPAMLAVLAATGVLRGLQDVRTPLLVAVVGAVANLGLNVALVHGAGWGIAGSAVGTAAVQTAMAVAVVTVVARGARREGVGLRPQLPGVRSAARAGVPLLIRTLTLRAALLVTTVVAARQGDAAIAAHQVAFAVWNLLALTLDAVAIAAQVVTGRALGAGDAAGARGLTRRMVRWGVATGAVLGAVTAATATFAAPLFSPDPAVQRALIAALLVAAALQPLAGYVFVLDGVLIGAGDGRYLARAGVATLLVYLPLAGLVAFARPGGAAGLALLWVTFAGGFMAARALTLARRARTDRWLVTGA